MSGPMEDMGVQRNVVGGDDVASLLLSVDEDNRDVELSDLIMVAALYLLELDDNDKVVDEDLNAVKHLTLLQFNASEGER